MDEFELALMKFVDGSTRVVKEDRNTNYPTLPVPVLVVSHGKRYVKIIREERVNGVVTDKSVHCFVDRTNGDVLKAAGWSRPAKHARGNIFNEDHGVGCMGPHGAAYLR